MVINEDIRALAKRAFELAELPVSDRAAHTLEALSVNGQIVGAATPAGIERAKAETEARWGAAIRKVGLAAILDPWWYLRSDDGKPPVIAGLIESAMTNPNRPLASVLRSFADVEPAKRAALTDQVRAFLGRAFEGALADARLRYVDVMRSRPAFNWPKDPWAAVLPYEQNDPPAQILVDAQGKTHDGGMFDDPEDDTLGEKLKFGAKDLAWAWGRRRGSPSISSRAPPSRAPPHCSSTSTTAASLRPVASTSIRRSMSRRSRSPERAKDTPWRTATGRTGRTATRRAAPRRTATATPRTAKRRMAPRRTARLRSGR